MPYAPRDEIERFRQICEAIGEALAPAGFGIVGCAPHVERVLASQLAKAGLHRVRPNAPFSSAGLPENRLYAEDRVRFVERAQAAVFVGGSSGTLQEFRLCVSHQIVPLIPVAGAGGAGAELAQRLLKDTSEFWKHAVDKRHVGVLASPDETPSAYAAAVLAVLAPSGASSGPSWWQFWKK